MVLDVDQIADKLKKVSGWKHEDGKIQKTYMLDDFKASLAFVNQVGDLAENAGHHPDILIQYNKVSLSLVSHDEGGITEKDFGLAEKIENL